MKRIKTDWKSNLGSNTLDDLIRVTLKDKAITRQYLSSKRDHRSNVGPHVDTEWFSGFFLEKMFVSKLNE